MTLTKFCKSKEFLSSSSAGAAALFLLFAIFLPAMNDNADAVVELKVAQGKILTNQEYQKIQQNKLENNIQIVESKLNKILIILCQNTESLLCK